MTIASYSKNLALAKGLVKYLSSPAKYQAELNEMQGFRIRLCRPWGYEAVGEPADEAAAGQYPIHFLARLPGSRDGHRPAGLQPKVLAQMVGHILADNWTADRAISDAVTKLQKIVSQAK